MFPGEKPPVLQSGHPSLSVFSDSIILSVSITNGDYSGSDMFWRSLDSIGKILLRHGFFVRGAITQNLMYHTGQIAIGPALVRAYELESKVAIYPRVILDRMESGETAIIVPPAMLPPEPDPKIPKISTRKSSDGWESLDVLRYNPEDRMMMGEKADEFQVSFLEDVRPHIIANLTCGHPSTVREKYDWFASYFNEVAAEFGVTEIAT